MNKPDNILAPFQFSAELDTKYLNEIFEGDPENAAYIFKLFLAEQETINTGIREALQKNDKIEFYELIHKTKTSFSFAGLPHITAQMEELERKCLQTDNVKELEQDTNLLLQAIKESVPLVEKEYSRLTLYLNAIFENKVYHS